MWPTELAQWMSPAEITEAAEAGDQPTDGKWPDMDALRAESNASMTQRAFQI